MADQDPEAEIAELETQLSTPDPAIEALRKTDPDEANAQEIARLRQINARLIAQRRSANLKDAKVAILSEFPLAPEHLVVGTTKAEMRKSAEAVHNAVAAAVAKATAQQQNGNTPPAGGEAGKTATVSAERKEWGAPPASASETVSATPQVDHEWNDLKAKAMEASTPAEKRSVIRDIRDKGVRMIPQTTFHLRVRGAEERAKTGGGPAPTT
jgi:hypothetical protein